MMVEEQVARIRGYLLLTAGAFLSIPGVALAADEGGTQLEEIVVTATKRAVNIEKVPLAVSVVSADLLQQLKISDPSDLNFVAPGLQKQQQSSLLGAANFFIRGVGTATFGGGVEPSVSTVIDDVVMGRSEMGVVQLFDLDRIEVLRGPQGTLFGMNSSAGLIHIVTTEPKINQLETVGHISYGHVDDATSGNDFLGQASVNIPLSGTSAMRVSAFAMQTDGPVKNISNPGENLGVTETGLRIKYLWKPTDNWKILLAADYASEHGAYNSFYTRRYDAPGGFAEAQDALVGIKASSDNAVIASNAATFGEFNVGGAQANINYTFADGSSITNIVSARAYNNHSAFDADELPVSFFDTVVPVFNDSQVTEELRFTSRTDSKFIYQAGLYYMHLKSVEHTILCGNLEPVLAPPPPGNCFLGSDYLIRNERDNKAVFGQGTYSITSAARLTAGGRYTVAKLEDHSIQTLGHAIAALNPVGSADVDVTDHNFSYRISGEYDLAPNVMSYVTYTRGFKASGIAQNANYAVGPETSFDYEVGIKSTLFDRRLIFNVGLYRETFDGYQATSFKRTGNVALYQLNNAGTLRAQGVEADLMAIPLSGLRLDSGFAFNDAKYKGDYAVACYPLEVVGTAGNNVCLPDGSTNVSGNQLALAPRFTATLAANYERSLNASLRGIVSVNYYYRSSFSYDPSLDPQMRVGGLSVVGASIGIEPEDARWRVSAFVRNLFNQHYPSQVRPDALAGASGDNLKGGNYWQALDASAFRSIGLALDYRF
ncbi:MAG: TonB-dependent receptor [Proteobacteria bacterium]|nr:TonB-dependent receptor [Pseudomonadota bacterium]